MRRSFLPRIPLSVHYRQARVRDVVAPVVVDRVDVGWCCDVKGLAADDGVVVERNEAGD